MHQTSSVIGWEDSHEFQNLQGACHAKPSRYLEPASGLVFSILPIMLV